MGPQALSSCHKVALAHLGENEGDQRQEAEAGSPALLALLRLLGRGAEDAWAHVACSCLYLCHLTPILNASKSHYTFLSKN